MPSRSVCVSTRFPARQRGVVLLVALIVLVAMTLAGVALVRSVDTANVIAGNMAFQQSAINAGERGTEAAIAGWLGAEGSNLSSDNKAAQGYSATRVDPAAGQTWDAFWNSIPANEKRVAAPAGATCAGNANADAACNTVSYVIHRLCASSGAPHTAANVCSQPPPSASEGESKGTSGLKVKPPPAVYYRITARIEGPRRTVSYIQTIVSRSQ